MLVYNDQSLLAACTFNTWHRDFASFLLPGSGESNDLRPAIICARHGPRHDTATEVQDGVLREGQRAWVKSENCTLLRHNTRDAPNPNSFTVDYCDMHTILIRDICAVERSEEILGTAGRATLSLHPMCVVGAQL